MYFNMVATSDHNYIGILQVGPSLKESKCDRIMQRKKHCNEAFKRVVPYEIYEAPSSKNQLTELVEYKLLIPGENTRVREKEIITFRGRRLYRTSSRLQIQFHNFSKYTNVH